MNVLYIRQNVFDFDLVYTNYIVICDIHVQLQQLIWLYN